MLEIPVLYRYLMALLWISGKTLSWHPGIQRQCCLWLITFHVFPTLQITLRRSAQLVMDIPILALMSRFLWDSWRKTICRAQYYGRRRVPLILNLHPLSLHSFCPMGHNFLFTHTTRHKYPDTPSTLRHLNHLITLWTHSSQTEKHQVRRKCFGIWSLCQVGKCSL